LNGFELERKRTLALLLRLGDRLEQGPLRQVYCNRDIQHQNVRWIGFDMDYTLAVYHREAFDKLSHSMVVDRLVERFGYAADVADIPFRGDFAIRGLVGDRETGHMLKVDAHRRVERGLHGLTPLSEEELSHYRMRPPILASKRFYNMDTLFQLPEGYLFAAIIDLFEGRGETVDYGKLADDIRSSIDSIHGDGTLKKQIVADLAKYIRHDRKLGDTLHRFRSAGKKLFLMTNSYFAYTEAVMTYLMDGGPSDYANWRGYFDVIVTGASKPSFFDGNAPFLALSESGDVEGEERNAMKRGVCYQHGNLKDFERMIGAQADEILYVGDHIYGDILRSKRDSAWRTCMIVPEMEHELRVGREHAAQAKRWSALETELHTLADSLALGAELRLRYEEDADLLLHGMGSEVRAEVEEVLRASGRHTDQIRRRHREIVQEIRELEKAVEDAHHPIWGPLFKAGNENSSFGEQVENYSDLYTSRVTNFLAYSPTVEQRAPRSRMPHEYVMLANASDDVPSDPKG
jgi:5'-nucleotidase